LEASRVGMPSFSAFKMSEYLIVWTALFVWILSSCSCQVTVTPENSTAVSHETQPITTPGENLTNCPVHFLGLCTNYECNPGGAPLGVCLITIVSVYSAIALSILLLITGITCFVTKKRARIIERPPLPNSEDIVPRSPVSLVGVISHNEYSAQQTQERAANSPPIELKSVKIPEVPKPQISTPTSTTQRNLGSLSFGGADAKVRDYVNLRADQALADRIELVRSRNPELKNKTKTIPNNKIHSPYADRSMSKSVEDFSANEGYYYNSLEKPPKSSNNRQKKPPSVAPKSKRDHQARRNASRSYENLSEPSSIGLHRAFSNEQTRANPASPTSLPVYENFGSKESQLGNRSVTPNLEGRVVPLPPMLDEESIEVRKIPNGGTNRRNNGGNMILKPPPKPHSINKNSGPSYINQSR
jgi:hypothetical protein